MDPSSSSGAVGVDPRLVAAGGAFPAVERERFCALVRSGRSVSAALASLGVTWRAYSVALETDVAFRRAVAEAEAEKWSVVEDQFFAAVQEGEPWAIREGLRRAPGVRERFSEEPTVVVSVAEVGPGVERVLALEAELQSRRSALEALETTGRESGVG